MCLLCSFCISLYTHTHTHTHISTYVDIQAIYGSVWYVFQGLHKWLHSRYTFLHSEFYPQDLFWIVLCVDVYRSRLFFLTAVREMFLNHRFGAVTSLS